MCTFNKAEHHMSAACFIDKENRIIRAESKAANGLKCQLAA